jgi:hypothetical protein
VAAADGVVDFVRAALDAADRPDRNG